ncbi:hypothetical protein C9J21_18370 [Photobacterium phosphoreum]|uniref:hypothetical protein n=1 Tax=Photobacterium phosphoreum TaxID=659 RepID=UPI000D157DDD|nr:hypothetical protein [Photobacterium phosphoreum]PSW30853.1 hypothetical protein C9J21_18370 [Photobacterium phosphoreum]
MNTLITDKIKFAKNTFNFTDLQLSRIYNVSRKTLNNWLNNSSTASMINQCRVYEVSSIFDEWINANYPTKGRLIAKQVEDLTNALTQKNRKKVMSLGAEWCECDQVSVALKNKSQERVSELELLSFKYNLASLNTSQLDDELLDLVLLQIDHNLGLITLTPEQRNQVISPYLLMHNLIIIDVFRFEYDRVVQETLIEIESNLSANSLTDKEKQDLSLQREILIACKPFLSNNYKIKSDYILAVKPAIQRLLSDGISESIIAKTLSVSQRLLSEVMSGKNEKP